MTHALAGLPEFSQYHRCSDWRWRLLFQLPPSVNCGLWQFFNAQSKAPIEIRHVCQVYGPNVMNKQMVRRWFRQFTAGQLHVHGEGSWRPSIITGEHVELVREPRIQWFLSFLTPQEIPVRSAFSNDKGGDVCHTVAPIPGGRLLRHSDTKFGPTVW